MNKESGMKISVIVALLSALGLVIQVPSQNQAQADDPPPTVTSITPDSAPNTDWVHITNLAGTNFREGAIVMLYRDGPWVGMLAASVTVVSSTQITCIFNLAGAEPGVWDVIVQNPPLVNNQFGRLYNAFTIYEPPPTTHDVALISLTASPNPVSKGQTLTFTYTVKNLGNVTEDNVTFQFSRNGRPLGKPQTVGSLTAGQETTKTLRVKIPRRQKSGHYSVTGEVPPVTGETNTEDNEAEVEVSVK